MKRVVTRGHLTQREMRPSDLHDAYEERVRADIVRFGLLQNARERHCPACGGQGDADFVRFECRYWRCRRCRSLFVSPLPQEAKLVRYCEQSEAERFRRDEMLPAIADVRARHTLAPRANWVLTSCAARGSAPLTIGYVGSMPQQLVELLRASPVVGLIEDLSDTTTEGSLDGLVAFDIFERSFDLAKTLHRCRTTLKPDGLLFVTTMSGEGFEIQMLRERAHSLVPPLHLQLLSRSGWDEALKREQLRILEYSTPGELDVQAVAEACRRDSGVQLPPIIDELVRNEDEQVGLAFQQMLQQAGLSSHVQLVAELPSARTER